MSQEDLASEAEVGVATVKRFESGKAIRGSVERSLRLALAKRGIVILESGSSLGGRKIGAGVAVLAEAFSNSLEAEDAGSSAKPPSRTRSI